MAGLEVGRYLENFTQIGLQAAGGPAHREINSPEEPDLARPALVLGATILKDTKPADLPVKQASNT